MVSLEIARKGTPACNLLFTCFFAIGILSLSGGIFDWDWFMNNRKAQQIVRLFSRTGARVFYVVLGVILLTVGRWAQRA